MRCFGDGDLLCAAYHNLEWGRPIRDETALFERISLESFQSGLSWLTILRRRPAFRSAFAGFDPVAVAAFDEDDLARLLADAGIVRNRAKILATIANARAVVALYESGPNLAEFIWGHVPATTGPHVSSEWVPASAPESAALAADLRAAGFRFVGPTTAYATMRACGVVNDHLVSCASYLADGFAQVDVSSGAIAATTARSPTSHGTSYSSRTASQRTAS